MESGRLVICTNSAGDRKLYAIAVDEAGDVWNNRKEVWEVFEKEKFNDYVVPLAYNGCDVYVYVLEIYPEIYPKIAIVYIQGGQEPSIYDQIYQVFGVEVPKEIPIKKTPDAPYFGLP